MSNFRKAKITDFRPDPANANKGTERGLRALDDSLSEVGLGRSIVTDKNGYIIGGNKTVERAVDQGFENALVVETTGDELVIVQRNDLDLLANEPNNRARKLAYYDNRVAQLDLAWDVEQVRMDIDSGLELGNLFHDWEVDNFVAPNEPFDPSKEWVGMPEYNQPEIKPFHSMMVHFMTEADMNDFARLLGQTVTDRTRYFYHPKQQPAVQKKHRVIDDES